jgi:hypothetical protein
MLWVGFEPITIYTLPYKVYIHALKFFFQNRRNFKIEIQSPVQDIWRIFEENIQERVI